MGWKINISIYLATLVAILISLVYESCATTTDGHNPGTEAREAVLFLFLPNIVYTAVLVLMLVWH